MISFEEVYKIVEESSHATAFDKEEAEALYQLLRLAVADEANIVEVGVEFGRSTSIFASVAKFKPGWHFTAIDNWSGEYHSAAEAHVKDQMKKYDWKFDLVSAESVSYSKEYKKEIDVLHIDADHTFASVLADCMAWVPKVKKGGFVLFDDFEHPSLPDVAEAVDRYCEKHDNIRFLDKASKLGIFEKK